MKRQHLSSQNDEHELRMFLDKCHQEPHVPLEVFENELLAESDDPKLVKMIREHQRQRALGIVRQTGTTPRRVRHAVHPSAAGKRRHPAKSR